MLTNILGPKPLNVLIPALLFVLLTPRFLVALNDGFVPMFNPMMTAAPSVVLLHAAVFAAAYALLRRTFPEFY